MELPNVKTTYLDQDNNITYVVYAYRSLEGEELVQTISAALSRTKKSMRPKRGETLEIHTVIGVR